MKTDDLIRTLAADAPSARGVRSVPLVAIALMAGLAISISAFAAWIGPRWDVAEAATTLRFLLKPLEMIGLAVLAAFALTRLMEPGVNARSALAAISIVPLFVAAAVAGELLITPSGTWAARLVGDNALKCLVLIPFLSLAPLAALIVAMRRGAPTRPALTGAIAGLTAGALGGLLYATHCPDDSPLFVAVWYSLAIAGVAAVGALIGARLLRW
jgi:hypothetical protein